MCVSTGNRYLDIGLSVAIGAATGGLGLSTMATSVGTSLVGAVAPTALMSVTGAALTSGALGAIGGATMGLATGILGAALMPQQPTYSLPQQTSQVAQLQQMNTNVATTGSGGRQAAKSLATAISRTKKRKLTQDDVGDLSLSTESFTNTGLQLA